MVFALALALTFALPAVALTLVSTTHSPTSTQALILLHACCLTASVTAHRLPPATPAPVSVGAAPGGRL